MNKVKKYSILLIIVIISVIVFDKLEYKTLSEDEVIEIVKQHIVETNLERGNTTPIDWNGYSFIITKQEDGSFAVNLRAYTEEKKDGTSGNLGWYYISRKGDIEVK